MFVLQLSTAFRHVCPTTAFAALEGDCPTAACAVFDCTVFVLQQAELILTCLPYSSYIQYTAAFYVPLLQLFLVNAAVGPTPPETLHGADT
jgi:hypothetical protein